LPYKKSTLPEFEIGVDIGGTFTDFVAREIHSGKLYTDKVFTTASPADAVFDGFARLDRGYDVELSNTRTILHATTLATNALIERRGASTGLLTTKGFEDILDIRKGLRYNQYDLKIRMPKPYVPRFLRRGVSERMLASGEPLHSLDPSDVLRAAQELVSDGVRSLAISFLHSYANPRHEIEAERVLRENFPDLPVSVSHNVTSQAREYERTSTVVVDAYVKPIISRYLEDLTKRLGEAGFEGKVYIMTCSGGVVDALVAKQIPVLLLESGPVAGVSMSAEIAKKSNLKGVFSFDMGGTTAKGCIIRNFTIEKSYEFEAARADKFRRGSGITISIPVVKLIETGSGGGSISSVDGMGMVRVGPRSAGAEPGPACYARGGEEPTVTDADLLLGYLDQDYFLGGKVNLHPELSRTAIERTICAKTGLEIEEAAWAIHERVNEDVAGAFRLYASEIGVDYRNYSFIAFGGAGPVHACRIAGKLGCSKIVIPPRAGVLSAEGLLATALSFDAAKTKRVELSDLSFELYREEFDVLIEKATSKLPDSGTTFFGKKARKIILERKLDMCYHGQGYDITVNLTEDNPTREEFDSLAGLFEKRYKEHYSLSGFSGNIEIVSFKVSAIIPHARLYDHSLGHRRDVSKRRKTRKAFDPAYMRFRNFAVLDRHSLSDGEEVKGPALVQEVESTTVIPSGFVARADKTGGLSIRE
jgi:N-methylhydantoinase A